jgi:hypothetical protein
MNLPQRLSSHRQGEHDVSLTLLLALTLIALLAELQSMWRKRKPGGSTVTNVADGSPHPQLINDAFYQDHPTELCRPVQPAALA